MSHRFSYWNRQSLFKLFVSAICILTFVALFVPFYSEVLLAAVFSLALEPIIVKLLSPLRLRWKVSVALLLFLIGLLMVVPFSLAIYKTYAYLVHLSSVGLYNTELFQKLLILRSEGVRLGNTLLETVGLSARLDLAAASEDALNSLAQFSVKLSTYVVTNLPRFFISLFVFCLAFYFFLAEAQTLRRSFLRQNFLAVGDADRLIEILQGNSYSTVITSVIIGLVQATMVSVGAMVFAATDFLLVFVTTFIFAFIPIVGAGPVAIVLTLYKLALGNYGQALGLAIVFLASVLIDNVLRPLLISASGSNLHPVISLLSVVGALLLFGMPGLFLGPVIAGVAIKIVPVLYPYDSRR